MADTAWFDALPDAGRGQAPVAKNAEWFDALPDAPTSAADKTVGSQDERASLGSVTENAAAGAARQGWNLMGALPLATGAVNLPIRAINAAAGTNIPLLENPGETASRWLAGKTGGKSAFDVQPQNWQENAAAAAGGAAASIPGWNLAGMGLRAAAPVGSVAAGVGGQMARMPILSNVGPVAAGAATGSAAASASPEWAAPTVDLLGNLTGAGLAQGAGNVTSSLWNIGARKAGMMGLLPKEQIGGQRVTGAQADAAAGQLNEALGPEGRNMLSAAPDVKVPGSMPTTAQVAPTGGMVALEQAGRTANPAPFLERAQQNNIARVQAIQGQAPTGQPAAVGELFRQRLAQIDALGQASTAAAREGVQNATEAAVAPRDAQGYGATIRGGLKAQEAIFAKPITALWQALDPEGKLTLNVQPLKTAGQTVTAEIDPAFGFVGDKEQKLLSGIAGLPDVTPFSRLKVLRSSISDIESDLRATPGNAQGLRRMAIIKSALDDSVAAAAERAAAQDPEVLARVRAAIAPAAEAVQGGSGLQAGVGGSASGPSGNQYPGAGGGARAAFSQTGGLGGAAGNPRVAQGRQLPPQDALTFLASKGGIKPGSELRMMDATIARPGLVRRSGMEHDYAREALMERGYLPANSTLADFYDLVNNGLHGRRGYGHDMPEYAPRGEGADEHHFMAAREDVRDAVASSGVRLSSEEIDAAASLVMNGQHPDAAIREIAAGTDERVLQSNAQRQAFENQSGMTPGAKQTSLGGTSPRPSVENFPTEKADQYAQARFGTREKYRIYGQGAVGDVLRGGKNGAPYQVLDSDVAARFLTSGESAPERVAAFIEAAGGQQQAVDALKSALTSELRSNGVVSPDGMLNTTGLRRWQQRRAGVLNQFPELKPLLGNAQAAQEAYDGAVAAHEAAMREFQNGVARHFLTDEPNIAVRKAFASGNPTQTFQQLVDAVKASPDAVAGLKRAVVEYILERMTSTAPAGASDVDFLKADVFQRFIRTNKGPLRVLFGGQGLQNFEAVAADLRRQAQRTAVTPGSDTTQKILQAKKNGFVQHGTEAGAYSVLALIGEQLGEHLHGGMLGTIGTAVALPMAGALLHALQQRGIQRTQDLLVEAMLRPDLARELLRRVPANGQMPVSWQRRTAASLLQSATVDQTTKH